MQWLYRKQLLQKQVFQSKYMKYHLSTPKNQGSFSYKTR